MKDYLSQVVALADTIRNKQSGTNFSCLEDYVLNKGRPYVFRELDASEREIVRRAKRQDSFPEGFCYANAQRLVLNDRSNKLVYVEGYAQGLIPFPHAWAVLGDVVIDLTWERFTFTNRSYYGVAFSREDVKARRKQKSLLALIDDWENRYPLFKQQRNP